MKIIPAIDLLDGKCVRLFKGDYNQVEVFNEDPVRMAIELESAGFKFLHLVDLDGARGSGSNLWALNEIARNTSLAVDFGGGIKNTDDVDKALKNGANQINIGSMAINNKALFMECITNYSSHIIWNADLKDGKLAINGWQECVDNDFDSLMQEFIQKGLKFVLTTDISKDGTLQGPNFELYRKLLDSYPTIHWIASGGISNSDDVERLKATKLYGAVIGKALYKGTVTYEALLKIQNAG